jgi:hypothetical protein
MARNIRIVVDMPLPEYETLKLLAGSPANVPHYIRKQVQENIQAWANRAATKEDTDSSTEPTTKQS